MTSAVSDAPAGDTKPSRIGMALLGLFTRRATVIDVDDVGEGFRLVTLEGAALRGAPWAAGHKIQVTTGSALSTRTYTPIDWDPVAGRTRLLGHIQGHGPGSGWLRTLKAGDRCEFFGPRRSLALAESSAPLVVFGDGTSIGPVYALQQQGRHPVHCRLEAGDVVAAERDLFRLRIGEVAVVSRSPGGSHLDEVEAAFVGPAAEAASFVLTGQAASMQPLRRCLRLLDVPTRRIACKAHWATGRSGLD